MNRLCFDSIVVTTAVDPASVVKNGILIHDDYGYVVLWLDEPAPTSRPEMARLFAKMWREDRCDSSYIRNFVVERDLENEPMYLGDGGFDGWAFKLPAQNKEDDTDRDGSGSNGANIKTENE